MTRVAKISLGIIFGIIALVVILAIINAFGIKPAAVSDLQTGRMGLSEGGYSVDAIAPTMSGNVSKSMMAPAAPGAENTGSSSDSSIRMVIKTGALSLVVKDVNESVKNIAALAEKAGGFVVSSNVYKRGLAPYGEITVRVPSNVFDQSVSSTKSLGEVVSENVNGQDVTEEYTDLDSQLRNLKATEQQFLVIMIKAVKISDILEVQRELSNVRSQIEVLQGRMKYLKQSADMSSISVNLSTDPSVLPSTQNDTTWKPFAVIKEAFRSLIALGKTTVDALIWLVVFIPLWLVIGLVIWLIYRVIKKISGPTKISPS